MTADTCHHCGYTINYDSRYWFHIRSGTRHCLMSTVATPSESGSGNAHPPAPPSDPTADYQITEGQRRMLDNHRRAWMASELARTSRIRRVLDDIVDRLARRDG